MNQQNKFLHHSPCENCGSRDNLGVYEDHTYCFGCRQYNTLNGELPEYTKPKELKDMIEGIVEALPSRKIDSDTCKKFNYQTGTHNGKTCTHRKLL